MAGQEEEGQLAWGREEPTGFLRPTVIESEKLLKRNQPDSAQRGSALYFHSSRVDSQSTRTFEESARLCQRWGKWPVPYLLPESPDKSLLRAGPLPTSSLSENALSLDRFH